MNPKKLRRLRRLLGALRTSVANMPSRKLESFAKALGREPEKRGKHPTYVSSILQNSRPITIPHHSKNLKKWTANSILDQLEQDLFTLEQMFNPRRETEKEDPCNGKDNTGIS